MRCILCPAKLTPKNTPDPPFDTVNICKKCLIRISKQIEEVNSYQIPGFKPQLLQSQKGGKKR